MTSTYLLDTNACIGLLNRSSASLIARFKEASPSQLRVCSVVKTELWFGVFNSARPAENQRRLQQFFRPLKSLPFDDACAQQAGLVRAELQRLGTVIGTLDILIAATALAFNVTLVTRNAGEFSRIRGLQHENWEV